MPASASPEIRLARDWRAGKRLALVALEEESPATMRVPGYLAVVRHLCSGQGDSSAPIEMIERYEPNPELSDGTTVVKAGVYAWIWRQGRCSKCKTVVRGDQGRVVLTSERPQIGARRN